MINRFILLSLFIIWPIGTLPIILINVVRNNRLSFVLLAIFMGLLSMYYFPFGDQYRYWIKMQTFRYASFEEAFDIDSILFFKSFNIVNITLFISAKIGLTIEQYRCIIMTFSYLIVMNLYIDICKKSILHYNNAKYLMLILFSIPYYTICYGFRTGLGSVLFASGVYFIYKKSIYKGITFIVLAICTHYVFLMYSVIFFLSALLKDKLKFKTIVLISILSYVCSYMLSCLYGYNDVIDMLLGAYISGEFGYEYKWEFNNFRFVFFVSIMPLLFMYFLYFKSQNNVFFENFIRICFVLIFLFCSFYTLFTRHMVIMIMILGIYLSLIGIKNRLYSSMEIVLLNVILVVSFLLPFRVNRYQYKVSNFREIVFSSLFHVLHNTYTEREVYLHTDFDGDFEP